MANTTHYSHPVMRERRIHSLAANLYALSDVLADQDKDRHAILTTDCFRAAEVFMKEADERMVKAVNKGIASGHEAQP